MLTPFSLFPDKDSIPNSPTTPAAPQVSKLELHAESWKVKNIHKTFYLKVKSSQKWKRRVKFAQSDFTRNRSEKHSPPRTLKSSARHYVARIRHKRRAKRRRARSRRESRDFRVNFENRRLALSLQNQLARLQTGNFTSKSQKSNKNSRTWDPTRRRSAPPIQTAFQRNQNFRKSPPKSAAPVQKRANRSPVQKGPEGPSPQKTGTGNSKNKKKTLSPQKKAPMQMSNGQRQVSISEKNLRVFFSFFYGAFIDLYEFIKFLWVLKGFINSSDFQGLLSIIE